MYKLTAVPAFHRNNYLWKLVVQGNAVTAEILVLEVLEAIMAKALLVTVVVINNGYGKHQNLIPLWMIQ